MLITFQLGLVWADSYARPIPNHVLLQPLPSPFFTKRLFPRVKHQSAAVDDGATLVELDAAGRFFYKEPSLRWGQP